MISGIEPLFLATFWLVPLAAVLAFFLSLLGPQSRAGVLPALGAAIVGFAIGASLGGGFQQTGGIGLGAVKALILGVAGAGSGYLLGLGLYLAWTPPRAVGVGLILLGLLLPGASLLELSVKPMLIQREVEWWRNAIGQPGGLTEQQRQAAPGHLPREAREKIRECIYGFPISRIPDTTLDFLFQQRLVSAEIRPMRGWLADKILQTDPHNELLAANPTTPPEILVKMAQTVDYQRTPDYYHLYTLLHNPSFPAGETEPIFVHVEQAVTGPHGREIVGVAMMVVRHRNIPLSRQFLEVAYSAKAVNENYTPMPDWLAEKFLAEGNHKEVLARNETTSSAMLSRLAHSIDFKSWDDRRVIDALARNPALPEADVVFLRTQINAVLAQGADPKFKESSVYWLRNLTAPRQPPRH